MPLAQTFLAEAAQSDSILLWTLILTSIGSLVTGVLALIKQALSDKQTIKLREQDRLDAEAKAKLILIEGAKREQRLSKQIADNTALTKEGIQKSTEALDAANNVNSKIEQHAEHTRKATETIASATVVVAKAIEERAKDPMNPLFQEGESEK